MSAVEPPVRSPGAAVGDVVYALAPEAIEQHERCTVGLVILVLVRDEQQVWRRDDPDAAEAVLDSRHARETVGEHAAAIVLSVAVSVFQDDDPVLPLLPLRIRVILGHPYAPVIIETEPDRLPHVRLGGEDAGHKSRRQR